MRNGFGLNTNLFETNVLNLAVVVGVVVTVVGDALSTLLKQRRETILSTLQEADNKAIESKNRLDEAKKSLERSRISANEIRLNAIQIAEKESKEVQKQSKNDIKRLQEKSTDNSTRTSTNNTNCVSASCRFGTNYSRKRIVENFWIEQFGSF